MPPLRRARRIASLIASRAVADLRPGDRATEYASLLDAARAAGYTFITVRELDARRRTATAPPNELLIALRHDVDIRNAAGNAMFHALETAAGAVSTSYFRLSTVKDHAKLIPRLLAAGFEVGYHYTWMVDLEQEADFMGKDALKRIEAEGVSQKLVGVDIEGEPLGSYIDNEMPDFFPVSVNGDVVGRVTSACHSPRLEKNIGLAMLPIEHTELSQL